MENCNLCHKSLDLGPDDRYGWHIVCATEYNRRKNNNICCVCGKNHIDKAYWCNACGKNGKAEGYHGP